MVVIDSSESSSDEEDRRLRPIRRQGDINFATETSVFEVSGKPEGSASSNFFVRKSDDVSRGPGGTFQNNDQQSPPANSHPENSILRRSITKNITQEIISHTKSLEDFVKKIEKIPLEILASQKLCIGLKLIDEYLCTANSSNIHSDDEYGYVASIDDDDDDDNDDKDDGGCYEEEDVESESNACRLNTNQNITDEWFNPFDGKDFISLNTNMLSQKCPGEYRAHNKQDASSQTNISGDVIPREATAALEFFQEIINSSQCN